MGELKKKLENDSYWVWDEAIKDDKLTAKLNIFLNKITDTVKQTGVWRTQDNESINSSIRWVMPKNKVFSTSIKAQKIIASKFLEKSIHTI